MVVAKRLTDMNGTATRTSAPKARAADRPTPHSTASPPKGVVIPTRRSSHILDRASRNKWSRSPLLSGGGIGPLRVGSLNVHSMNTVAGKNRAEELWFEAFKGDHAELRNEAARALGDLAKTSPAAANLLIEGLGDSRPGVRLSALDGLEAAGPPRCAARPRPF